MQNRFLKLLLDVDQETGGETNPEGTPPEGSEDGVSSEQKEADLKALQESVAKLEKAIKAERDLKHEADRKAAEARKAAEDATKTAEQRMEERLRTLESENMSLKLERMRDAAIRDELEAAEKTGHIVNMSDLAETLSVTSLNEENVKRVVGLVVSKLKRPNTIKVENSNTNPNPDNPGAKKLGFGLLSDDALSS